MTYNFLGIINIHDNGCDITILGQSGKSFIQLHKVMLDMLDCHNLDVRLRAEMYIAAEMDELVAQYGDAYDINLVNTQIITI
jgi:hypothetical protein